MPRGKVTCVASCPVLATYKFTDFILIYKDSQTLKYPFCAIFFLGKYVNHKGRNRHFTSPEELEQERKQEEMKKSVKGAKVFDICVNLISFGAYF